MNQTTADTPTSPSNPVTRVPRATARAATRVTGPDHPQPNQPDLWHTRWQQALTHTNGTPIKIATPNQPPPPAATKPADRDTTIWIYPAEHIIGNDPHNHTYTTTSHPDTHNHTHLAFEYRNPTHPEAFTHKRLHISFGTVFTTHGTLWGTIHEVTEAATAEYGETQILVVGKSVVWRATDWIRHMTRTPQRQD